jgi:hypothetical protein
MLLLLFGCVIFLFMFVGAVAFLFCIALRPTRRFALSTALWWAAWGPCSVALITVAGLTLVADTFISKNGQAHLLRDPHLFSTIGWAYLGGAALLNTLVASIAAWIHQFLIRRFPFPLFRLYAVAVVSGIGSVFGWSFSWWMLDRDVPHTWVWSLLSMLLLVTSFGAAAYRGAQTLRGGAAANQESLPRP